MKIVIGIPSLNEEKTIAHVVRSIDIGLASLCPAKEAVIVNVDSGSDDRTVVEFDATFTRCGKHRIVADTGARGKGRNVLELLSFASALDADVVATIDADLTSITPIWINSLLQPVLDGRADFVTPLYCRSRYEGSTTNHFAVPLVYAKFQQLIRQPIGGEFAMSRNFLTYLGRQVPPRTAYRYGIDIYLTVHALGGGFATAQVHLGKKSHKPSFSNMSTMFPEVAQSCFASMKQYPTAPVENRLMSKLESLPCGIDQYGEFGHKANVNSLMRQAFIRYCALLTEFGHELGQVIDTKYLKQNFFQPCPLAEWAEILAQFSITIAPFDNPLLAGRIGEALYPLFARRAVTFWRDSEHMSAEEAEQELLQQVELIATLSSARGGNL